MNVKRISSGVYEVAVVGGLMTPAEHEKLYKQVTERLQDALEYQPTDQELEAEALLWDWIDGRSA